jgi:hypothetical protein
MTESILFGIGSSRHGSVRRAECRAKGLNNSTAILLKKVRSTRQAQSTAEDILGHASAACSVAGKRRL